MRRVLRLRTPENVTFELELAGLAARAAAWLVDAVVIALATAGIGGVLSLVSAASMGLGSALYPLVAFAAQWGYGATFEALGRGQTPGKRLLRLRVVDAQGFAVTGTQAILRNLLKVVDLAPVFFGVGALSVVLSSRAQRLGDLAAGTIVISERERPLPQELVAGGERYNSFASDPRLGLVARRVSPKERDAMVALAVRRESLPLAVRTRLFSRLARHIEEKFGLPKPGFFSDENYVLHVASAVIAHARDQGPL